MDSKFLLLSFVLILSGLSIIGGVFAVDNGTAFGDSNMYSDVSNLEFSQNYTPDSINKGQIFEIFLSVKNTGDDPYRNLTVLYRLPEGLDLLIWPDEYSDNSIWTIDTLYPNETSSLTLVCVPKYSNYTYTFTATDPGYDTIDVHTNPLADLAVGVDYIVGDGVVKWVVNVINNGPDHGVDTIVNNLPTDLGVIAYNLTKGDLVDAEWLIDDLANGEVQTLTLITHFVEGYKYNINVTSDTYSDVISNNVSGIVRVNNSSNIPVYSEILDANSTANPIMLLVLAVIFIPFLRFKKD
ncbi:hypothetical protein [Methanobrevibacter sp.]|uniref:hypothetical protein n=1 Tax=Methanobrevibacter sp. TaxID=66852 RepID=UPI00388F5EF1